MTRKAEQHTVTELIRRISKASDRYGDKLLQFMDEYDLVGICQATEQQLLEFIEKEDIHE